VVAIVVVQVLLLSGAVFLATRVERNAAVHAGHQAEESGRMLTAMLDQETGARGYFETRDARFLQPWLSGTSNFALALTSSRALAGSDPGLQRTLADEARRSARWHVLTETEIRVARTTGVRPSIGAALDGKVLMDAFRSANASYDSRLRADRDHALWSASWFGVALAAALSFAFLSAGVVVVRRASRRARDREGSRTDLRALLHVSASEHEARALLIRHLENIVPGSGVAVLSLDDLSGRLEPILGRRAESTPLHALETGPLEPSSCMAIRLGQSVDRNRTSDPVLRCAVCGALEGDVVCEPMLVAGQLIGSVLVSRRRAISED
jgi:CHASE3 domain sensor protein